MANYHLNMSYGAKGKGEPHANYILGEGDYKYKKEEIAYVSSHLPKWASTSQEFFKVTDDLERVNGRAYREIRISLPQEFSLEENKKLLDDFISSELQNKYFFTAVIHEKESEFSGVNNVHAHIMFCQRELDGIERDKEIFFKRANSKNPSLGGCKKNREWDSREKLFEVRKNWETIQNKHLEKNNIEKRVSCETLEKQREIALEKGDLSLAKSLDRVPVNVDGYLLKKKNLSGVEQEKIETFKSSKELKELCAEALILEKQIEELRNSQEATKEIDKKLNLAETKIMEKENENAPYSHAFDIVENIEIVTFEMLKTENKIKNDLDVLTYEKLSPGYEELSNKFKNISSDHPEFLDIENKLNEIEKNIPLEEFNKTKDNLKGELEQKINSLKISKAVEEEKLKDIEKTDGINNFISKKLEKEFSFNFNEYIETKIAKGNLEKELKSIQTFKKDPANFEKAGLNILTAGEYSKTETRLKKLKGEFEILEAGYEYKTLTSQEMKIAPDKLKKLSEEIKKYEEKFEKIKSNLNSPMMKNKNIRIVEKMKSNYDSKEEKCISSLCEKNLKFDILKSKLEVNENTKGNIKEYIRDLKNSNEFLKAKEEKRVKFEEIKGKFEGKFSEEQLTRLAYNKLTSGKYLNYIKEYNILKDTKNSAEKELAVLENNLKDRIFNSKKINELKNLINSCEIQQAKIKGEFDELKNSIPKDKIDEAVFKLKEIKLNTHNKLDEFVNENSYKEEINENYQKIKEAESISKEQEKMPSTQNLMDCLKNIDISNYSKGRALEGANVNTRAEFGKKEKNDWGIEF